MKKNILALTRSLFAFLTEKAYGLLLTLVLVLNFGFVEKANAQCIGAYAGYESFGANATKTSMTANGWVFSAAAVTPATSASNSRTGSNFLNMGTTFPTNSIITPVIANPKIFQFYFRSSIATRDVNFIVEWFNSDLSTRLGFEDRITNGTTYTSYSKDLSAFTNVRVKVTLTGVTVGTGTPAMFIDDISWTSTINSQNIIVVPELLNSICSPVTVPAPGSGVLKLYDQGGLSDNYNTPRTYISAATASSLGTTVTVSSTANLVVGMYLIVQSGTGAFAPGTTVTSILNGTSFTVSATPTTALTGATVFGTLATTPYISGGASSIGTTVTVTTTANLVVGMSIARASGGAGTFAPGTTVTSIDSPTTFTVSNTPTTAISGGAVVRGAPPQTQIVVFKPDIPTDKVRLTFVNSFALDASANITVYNGNGAIAGNEFANANAYTNTSVLPGGTQSPLNSFTSTDPGGFITVKFVSSIGTPLSGFEINVECPESLAITSLGTTSGCSGDPLVINGTGFTGAVATNIKVGGTPVVSSIVSNAGTVLTVIPAPGSSGAVSVTNGNTVSFGAYTVNPLPTATANSSGSTCAGNPLSLIGGASGGSGGSVYSYSWSGPGFTNATQSPLVSNTATTAMTGTYSLIVTDSNLCSSTAATTAVTIIAPPTSSTNGGNITTCRGNTTLGLGGNTPTVGTGLWTCTGAPSGGNTSAITFNTATTPNATASVAAGAVAGDYTLTWTISNAGCTPSSSSLILTVVAPPTTSSNGGNKSACIGTTTSALGGNTPIIGSGLWTCTIAPTGGSTSDISFTSASTGDTTAIVSPTATAGNYILRWTISNTGCTSSISVLTLTVTAPPEAVTVSASANNNVVCVGQPINLSSNSNNNTVSYSWLGPNGFSSSLQNPTVSNSATVNMSGNYTVTASLGSGCTAQSTVNVNVLAPVGVVNPTLLNGCVTQSDPNAIAAMFLSLPSDTSIISNITVNWGDGSPTQSIPSPWTSIITHSYPTGNYTVTITTTSTSGCIVTKTYNAFVGSSPQAATLSLFANQATGCIPHTTQFTFGIPINNSNGTSYSICFGDGSPCITFIDGDPIPSNWVVGTPANGFNFYTISHIYSSTSCGNTVNLNGTSYSNVYLASVITSNPCTAPQSQAVGLISVGIAPSASFTPNPIPNICTNSPLILTNTSNAGVTINPVSFVCTQTAPFYWTVSPSGSGLWNASGLGSNNGVSNNELFWSLGSNTPSITFLQPGTYTITLFVKNSCGLSQVSRQVCVENPLVPQFTLSGTEFCTPGNVTTTSTTNLTNSCSVTYQWNVIYADGYCGAAPPVWSYTNGTSASSANPSFSFVTPGTYGISLTTTNSCGTVTSPIQTIIIKKPPTVAITSIPDICLGATVTPTISVNSCSNLALPTSQPAYSWTATGATPSTSNAVIPPTFSYATPGTYNIILSVTNECGTTNVIQSIVVNPISINTGPSSVCAGQTITLTANSAGAATNPWVSSNPSVATVSTTGVVTGIAAGTTSITFTNSSNCQTTKIITVNPIIPSSVSIQSTATLICPGISVTFTATPTNGGSAPSYQWQVNGVNIGTNSATYTSAALANNDVVSVIMISNASPCLTGSPATSNAITMTSNATFPASVSIVASATSICPGASATFTATPNNGGALPTYQWKVNGVNVGINSTTFTSTTIANNDVVSVVMTTNESPCLSGSSATSNSITMTVNPVVDALVIIGATGTTICPGTSVSFNATPINGGSSPSFQWKVNGVNVGSNSPIYTTTTLANNDEVSVVMTSNAGPCLTGSPATSNSIFVTVDPILPASVSIGASATAICSGTSVTFTATPVNGGDSPSYQWKVNGVNVGNNAATYTSTTLASNDAVSVVMTSNASPCLTGSPATSNSVTMTLNPILPASVSIGVAATTICIGTSTTFTATPTNGGTTPSYQWQVNGVNVGTNSATYTSTTLVNNDVVRVVMTSNASSCLAGSPATSNSITMAVTPANTVNAASSTPTLCINTVLTAITHTTTRATGIGTATGLPSGVTATWSTNTITISGTPTASGTFNYSIPLIGGCGTVNATGTITVTTANTVTAASSAPTLCINTALTAITHTTARATGIGTATGLPAGVTAAWATNTITISGTPTVSGTFNYSIPLTGGCGVVNATGTITVTPANTVTAASSAPTLCINTALTAITHTTTRATGIGTASGLPAGVTAAWATNTITISGTPTVSGTFNYSIPLTGGCGAVNATGTITVTPVNTVTAASSTPTLCVNTALTAITHTTTRATGIGTATGLPTGVTASWSANTITIIGTPTASGTFNYSIPLTGGCGTVNATGTIVINPNLPASVSIGASATTICLGTIVTFNATTTNGGASPTYQWKLNGVNVGTNSPVYTTTTLSNGNVVSLVMTSNASPCVTGSPATSNSITITVTPANTVTAASSTPTTCINTALTAITHTTTRATGIGTATGLPAGVTATWASNTITISGTPTVTGTFTYSIPLTGGCGAVNATGIIVVNPVNSVTTASSTPTSCINTALPAITHTTTGATGIGAATGLPAGVTATWATNTITISGIPTVSGTFNYSIPLTGGCGAVNATGTIVINSSLPASVSIGASATTICSGTSVTFNATTTNGGASPTYQWKLNGVNVGTNSPIYTTTTLSNSNVVSLVMTSNASPCLTGSPATSNSITITVTPANTVTAASSTPTTCINTALTAITHTTTRATGIGTATGLPAGVTASWATNTITISGTPTVSGTFNYSIQLTGGCGAVNATGIIVVNPVNSVTTASTTPTLCINTALTAITHTTTGATGIGTATGLPAGVTATWATNTITISGIPTSSGTFNYSIPLTGGCVALNATGTITVRPNNTISAASSSPTLCRNTALTAITHTTTGATGIGTATGLPTGVTALWASNTITISGTPTAAGIFNYSIPLTGGCDSVNATGTIIVKLGGQPAISIAATATTICSGTNVTFTATATPEVIGISPSYEWYVNGVDVGTNSATFSSSTLVNNDFVGVYLTNIFDYLCGIVPPGLSGDGVSMIVNPVLQASVSIGASATTICSGTSVTFNATVTNGGASPSYQWKLNGNNVGVNSPIYTTTTLSNNDVVSLVMTSNASPCLAGSPATSNSITISVNPVLPASVSIGASATSICSGSNVTFNATPTNGGLSPSYQWKVNGVNVGNNSAIYSTTTLSNNDVVSVVMTSNASPCLAGSPATSNSISISVTPALPASISIGASATTICSGSSVTFTATPVNGGTAPSYQWKVNGVNVGADSPIYATTTLSNNDEVSLVMTSNASPCLTDSPATSNSITITVNQTITPSFTQVEPICIGTSLAALPTTSINGIEGTWSPDINNTATTTYTFTPTPGLCATTTTMTISVVTIGCPSIQNLCTKTIQSYYVNTDDASHNGSSYAWSISPSTPSAILTGNGTNSITIDWTNAPSGTYTLETIETSIDGCVSIPVSAIINLTPTELPVAQPQTFCASATVANLMATGTNLQWYANDTNGTVLLSDTYLTSGTYYVSQTINGCESLRLPINIMVIPNSSEQTETACDSYIWSENGETYITSGTYTYTGTNAAGCTLTKTLVLTINNSTSSVETATSPTCGTYTWSENSTTYTSSGTYTSTSTNAAGCPDTKTLVLTINPCPSVVTVKMNIQGFTLPNGMMRPVLANQGVGSSTTDVDNVNIELHNTTAPFAIFATTTAMLQTNGDAIATFSSATVGSFYIVVRHRNSLETWSSNPVTIGASTTYDFTDSASKAYGDNMILVGGKYAIYNGDLNQDGFVESGDYPSLYNDSDAGLEGYYSTDLNGDGFVESGDYPILFNNSDSGIETLRP